MTRETDKDPRDLRIRLARPLLGDEELDAVREVFASGTLTNGPATAEFESAFAEVHAAEHGVAFANGTVSLTAILLAHGIGPGDEVIVPSLTFISTATSVLHAGATPVFADVAEDTYNLDPADAARRVTRRTRAIMPVHYGGQPADLDEFADLAADFGGVLIEDAAQAHGAQYKGRPVGTFGSAGMFSFTPTKNITTGEGGMVVTNSSDLAERLRLLRNHGQASLYQHESLGFNWRLSDIQSAIGTVQLRKLGGVLDRKQHVIERLDAGLHGVPGVTTPAVRADRSHVHMLYSPRIREGRDQLLEHLLDNGIEARVYFPPAHLQPVFRDCNATDLPVTEMLGEELISVPAHAGLSDDEITDVVEAFRDGIAAIS